MDLKSVPFTLRDLSATSLSSSLLHPFLSPAHSSKCNFPPLSPSLSAREASLRCTTRCPRVLHTPNVAFAPTEQTQQSAGPTHKNGNE